MGVVLAVAAIAIAQSWNRWLDPIIDTGRDLYIPEQMRGGVTIYRDIVYYYPPLTPYLLALITAITGSSIAAYAGIGMTIAVLTAAALYFGGRVTGGRTTAFSAALLFAACSIAGRSTWGTNYLFPYSHAATLGTLFFAAFVAFLCDFLFGRRAVGSLVVALAFALAASWTKAEYAVFTAIVIAMNFGHGMMFGLESCYFPELFGPRVRYSGASFGFQVSAAIGGGFAPIIATAMAGYFGGTTGVSIMMIVLALITLAAALAARETRGGSLTE